MSKLDFLEISRYFKSYYRTLRDVHYYLTNDSEVSPEELQAVSKVLSKLIYGFIRVNGKAFIEMNSEQYEQAYHLFHQDFLSVIQKSGENNVGFDQFTALIDEILEIAIKRTNALGKIGIGRQETLMESSESAEVMDNEVELSNANETIGADEVTVEVVEINNELNKVVPKVENVSTGVVNANAEVKKISAELEGVKAKPENTQAVKAENEVVTFDVDAGDVTATTKEVKVQKKFVDAGPIANKFKDYESSDNFRFRPRRRKNR